MRIAWLVIAVFAGRFFATAVYLPQGDGDLGWQRWLGGRVLTTHVLPQRLGPETFTAPGARWVPQEWLFSVLAYASGSAGWFLFAGFCAFCASAALALVAWNSVRRGAHPYAVALVTALAGVALSESFGVRVQILAWPLLAAYMLLLDTDRRVAYLAVAVAALWSNIHASVVLAPVVASVVCFGNFLDRARGPLVRRSAIIAVLSAAATCANPLGVKIPIYAYILFSSPFKSMIVEWHRTTLGDISFAAGALPLLLCILAFGIQGTRRWRDRLILAMFAWLMFSAARNVAVFALAAVPLAACAITAAVPYLRDRAGSVIKNRFPGMRFVEVAAAVAFAVAVAATMLDQERRDPVRDTQPHAALAAIEALRGPHNVLCADFAWCSFLLASTHARVFLDGRADPYPQSVWNDYERIVRVRPDWQKTLRERNVDVVLVARAVPLEQALLLAPHWRSVYVDRDFRVWTRDARTTRANRRPYVRNDILSKMPTSVNAAI